MFEEWETTAAAARLQAVCEKHLEDAYPGAWDRCPYYRLELRHYLPILNAIRVRRHPVGRYAIRNGWDAGKYENVGRDLMANFALFLTCGPAMTQDPEHKAKVRAYLDTPADAHSPRAYEDLVMGEVLGTFIKRVRPGIERYYHRIE